MTERIAWLTCPACKREYVGAEEGGMLWCPDYCRDCCTCGGPTSGDYTPHPLPRPAATPQVGHMVRHYVGNMTRGTRIEKVGPKRVLVSYVTKKDAREARRFPEYYPDGPRRKTTYVPRARLVPVSGALGRWRVALGIGG